MSSLAIDTLRYVKRLRAVGFTEEQAEVQAEALVEAVRDSLVTKADLHEAIESLRQDLRGEIGEMRNEIARVQSELQGQIEKSHSSLRSEIEKSHNTLRSEIEKSHSSLRSEIGEVRIEIRDAHSALLRWLIPLIIGQTAVVVALVKLL